MKRVLLTVVAVVAILGMVAPVAMAQAPTPKVTIHGLVDQITSWSKNMNVEDSNVSYKKDEEWYARTRVRPDISAEVGTTKFVLGLEFDFAWGQTGAADTTANRFGTSGGWDLNTDTVGKTEVKWAYTEFATPFLPKGSMITLGAQPFRVNYKNGTLATGDFAGVNNVVAIMDGLKLHTTYAQIEEKGPGVKFGFNGEDRAIIASIEWMPVKNVNLRPIFAYAEFDGNTSGSARQGRGGGQSYQNGDHEHRYTIGIDSKNNFGAFYVDPTYYYQWGNRDFTGNASTAASGGCPNGGRCDQDRSAHYFDIRGGWQAGPLLLEAAFIYTTGNKASENIQADNEDINYYEPIDTDSGFYGGWANIVGLGIDYFNSVLYRAGGLGGVSGIGYDKYGLMRAGFRGGYALTPTFRPNIAVTGNWSAKKVDTDGAITNGGGLSYGDGSSDSRYLGTELDLGFTWRFAPNVAFDLVGAYYWTGKAMESATAVGNTGPPGGSTSNTNAKDIQTVAARVRFTF